MSSRPVAAPSAPALFQLLRIAVALCFIGHGAFGIIGKEAWLPYFAVTGISEPLAWRLMPIIGMLDIAVGIAALVYPTWAGFAWAAFWAALTASIRPIAGESVFELIERAGNYGIPLAVLAWAGRPRSVGAAFARMRAPSLEAARSVRLQRVLVVSTALLLAGHGGLGLFEKKPLLAGHYAGIGLSASLVPPIGALELALAITLIARPLPALLVGAALWKIATELLFPFTGAPIWEFVERGGSYVAPLAAAWLIRAGGVAPTPRFATAAPAGLLSLALGFGSMPASIIPEGTLLTGNPTGAPAAVQDTSLVAQLRAGGLVMVCRHAITDRSRQDRHPVDLSDRSTQRNLSPEGEKQARELGRQLTRLGIPIGEVLTSPYARTRESAELAFGRYEDHSALAFNGSDEEMRRLLSAVPGSGNRVLMSHAGRVFRVIDQDTLRGLDEGDCGVVEPLGEGFRVLGKVF